MLDEPSSGLDPIVRRDILAAIIRTIAEEGRTVLFSSHLLVGSRARFGPRGDDPIRANLFCDSLERIKRSHTRLSLSFAEPVVAPPPLGGVLTWDGGGREWTAICAGPPRGARGRQELGARVDDQAPLPLDEIFVAYSGAWCAALREED